MLPSFCPGPPLHPPCRHGPDDEEVPIRLIVLLERAVDRDRPVEVFLIPPARDVERRHRDAREVRAHRLPLPEVVVVRMRGEVGPRRQLLVLEHLRLDVRQRPDVQIPLVRVVAVEVEVGVLLASPP